MGSQSFVQKLNYKCVRRLLCLLRIFHRCGSPQFDERVRAFSVRQICRMTNTLLRATTSQRLTTSFLSGISSMPDSILSRSAKYCCRRGETSDLSTSVPHPSRDIKHKLVTLKKLALLWVRLPNLKLLLPRNSRSTAQAREGAGARRSFRSGTRGGSPRPGSSGCVSRPCPAATTEGPFSARF